MSFNGMNLEEYFNLSQVQRDAIEQRYRSRSRAAVGSSPSGVFKPWRRNDDQALAEARGLVKRLEAQKSAAKQAEQLALVRGEAKRKEAERKAAENAGAAATNDAKMAEGNARIARNSEAARRAYAQKPLRKMNGMRNNVRVIPDRVAIGRIGKEFPFTKMQFPRGFPGGQNRCYRNSILQCVFHTPEFYHLMGNIHKDCPYETRECLTCALQYMLTTYWNGTGYPVELVTRSDELFEAIKINFTYKGDLDIINGLQADPFDLITSFVRYIERDITGSDPNTPLDLPIRDAEVNSNNFTVPSVFDVDYIESWTCVDCNEHHPAPAVSAFGLDINVLEVQEVRRIEDYLEDYEMSPFYSRQPYRCDSEACRVRALQHGYVAPDQLRRKLIVNAPEILVVRLNRVKDEDEVNSQRIVYQEQLDLTRYSASGNDIRYKLRGIVDHIGSTQNGHYTAAVLCRPLTFLPEQGSRYCRVNETSLGPLMSDARDLLNPEDRDVYVLVYSKVP
ncbi:uncharacterized protein RCC_04934 [Ramularia collo-cygni]|uniref:USP domain-containing protein n=1 Tax=Ramularia collo-cygni TaxID=112498 RepID=A0A2D3UV22_9PEZI|nr:uncharacterized protein RCC_04934 [Ramularia collo-cygni]CZT19088.1 uncharacterized protein RCC_04934 [Ramularia collo-cygni]